MGWLRGEAVQVKRFHEAGRDEYNVPFFDETVETVENVLVAPASTEDIGEDRPLGVDVRYTLQFPKTFKGPIENGEVCVRGEWMKTIGFADRFDPCPTDWNMTVRVGTVHG